VTDKFPRLDLDWDGEETVERSFSRQLVDARGRNCPLPIVALARVIDLAKQGTEVELLADDPIFPEVVRAWCHKTRNDLVSLVDAGPGFRAVVRKR
jgi:TusA-related sulfurtransferase